MPITEARATLGDVAGTAATLVRATAQSVSAQLQDSRAIAPPASEIFPPPLVIRQEIEQDKERTTLPLSRRLTVFLCHASEDKESARELRQRLLQDGFDPWLDEANLLPGQEWETEIPRAVREANVVVVCLSSRTIDKTGYVQREIRIALDAAEERPQGAIFVIPARIEECQVPERLSRWQRVDLFAKSGYERLCSALDAVRIHEG